MIWLISFSFSTSISITFDTVLIFLGIYHWYVSLGFHIVTFTVEIGRASCRERV